MCGTLSESNEQKMAAVGQLKIEELDEEDMASRRARRGMALNLLKPDTDAKILKVKMAQELHQALSAGEDVLRNLRKFDIIVSMKGCCLNRKNRKNYLTLKKVLDKTSQIKSRLAE
jgi:hypothetical protein